MPIDGFGLDVIMLSSREKYIEVLFFARKAPVNTARVSPGHPIIPLKSNKFNMAAVSVKRSVLRYCETSQSCISLA